MEKILIVEDEEKQLDILRDYFLSEKYEVLAVMDGTSAVRSALAENPDLIVLDLMLPGKSGLDVCRELRERGLTKPIIMLTAKGEEIDKVLGLETGADDYVTKPFSLRELHARVRARLRYGCRNVETCRLANGLTVDFKTATVEDGKKRKKLSRTEIRILHYFMANRGKVVSRDDLYDNVWGYDSVPDSRTVDAHVVNLRKKIELDYKTPKVLLTAHGHGYILK